MNNNPTFSLSRFATTIIVTLVSATLSLAQLTPAQAIAEMGRGINLGNTLEPPLEGGWNNPNAQESYFDAYVEAGFTNIRIPVRWDQHTGNTAPFAVNESWMNRVEQVVDWGLARGLYVTLNGHHEDWLKTGYNNANLRARYDSIWVQVVERFKDKSDKLLMEIINEPNGMTVAQVDDLNARVLGIIREQNPTRLVIFGGNVYANAEQLFDAAIPDDDFVIGYYHSYDPWNFAGLGQGTWGTASDYQQVANKFQAVENWSNTNDIPIHLSEFGAVVSNDYNSRMRFYAFYTEKSIEHGFAFSVWDDGGMFKVLQRETNSWPETKDILMHYYPDSPNNVTSVIEYDAATDLPMSIVEWNNRTTDNGEIIIERAVNNGQFEQVASLASNATSYLDSNIEPGRAYIYRMYTSKSDGTLLHGYPTRVVITSDVQGPFNGTPIEIAGVLEAEHFDLGGEGVGYHDGDIANQGGAFRVDESVDIGGDGNGGFILGYVERDEWLEYAVDVKTAGRYSVSARVASEVANGSFRITFDGNGANTTVNTPSTGGWVTFQNVSANSEPVLEAGIQQMRLEIIGNNPFNLDHLTFTLQQATSTNQLDDVANFTIGPNPVDSQLTIGVADHLVGKAVKIQLFDMQGKEVLKQQTTKQQTDVNLVLLPKGVYIVRCKADDTTFVRQIIRQ